MKRTEIIEKMTAIVEETMEFYKSDFYNIDKKMVASPEFKLPFIWIVGRTHTYRLDLGNYRDDFYNNESVRYEYLRSENPFSYFFTESTYKQDKWFIIDKHGICPIDLMAAGRFVAFYVSQAVKSWDDEFGPLPKLTKIPVKLSGITFSELKALISECRAHGDDSLLKCLKGLKNYCRVAGDQYVSVSYDKRWNEFSFCEYINGQTRLVGGITFHGWPETGYQTNNSVQLDPNYGWSSHT